MVFSVGTGSKICKSYCRYSQTTPIRAKELWAFSKWALDGSIVNVASEIRRLNGQPVVRSGYSRTPHDKNRWLDSTMPFVVFSPDFSSSRLQSTWGQRWKWRNDMKPFYPTGRSLPKTSLLLEIQKTFLHPAAIIFPDILWKLAWRNQRFHPRLPGNNPAISSPVVTWQNIMILVMRVASLRGRFRNPKQPATPKPSS